MFATQATPVTYATWRLYPLCPHSIAHTSRHHGGVLYWPSDLQTFRGSLKDFATFKLSDARYNRRSWNFKVSRTPSISWDKRPLLSLRPPFIQWKGARRSNSAATLNPNSKSPGAASIKDS